MTEVFVNGCFDVLHVGHIRLLQFAASYGRLTVGINSDESIKRLKGQKRPIFPEHERREMLLAIKGVAQVEIFHDDTPTNLIAGLYALGIGPKYVVKGLDYDKKHIPERYLIEKNGGVIVFFGMIKGRSTTDTLKRMMS